ncbi:hypothetical protein NDN08_001706 [Rhodosorus marinus]|uniref:F-box domain-containing protein n=1 Tax=Rhodosorus marinus TaxID=101924 RepID=A0AAV8UVX8_9RHOD|nr:hypothetical protein NDN08_001706 [Rhodosorus marinus]
MRNLCSFNSPMDVSAVGKEEDCLTDVFGELPLYLSVGVLDHLRSEDIVRLPAVSRKWRNLFQDPSNDSLWMHLAKKKFLLTSRREEWKGMSWGEIYLLLHKLPCHNCVASANPIHPGYYMISALLTDADGRYYGFPVCSKCFKDPKSASMPRAVSRKILADLHGEAFLESLDDSSSLTIISVDTTWEKAFEAYLYSALSEDVAI